MLTFFIVSFDLSYYYSRGKTTDFFTLISGITLSLSNLPSLFPIVGGVALVPNSPSSLD